MTRAADLVRSTARLGVARGIDSLQRFAYLRRYGKMFLAVSNGRFQVASRSHQSLLDEVAPWVDRLVASGRDKNAPARLAVIARRAQEALFSVCRPDAGPTVWRAFLIVLGEAELSLLHAGKSPTRRPLPRLSRGWLAAIDDGTPAGGLAVRLALALASQHRPWEPGSGGLVDSVRRHFLPMIDWDKPRARFKLDNDGRVRNDPEYVCMGRDLVTVAIQLVERRSIWARLLSKQRNPSPLLPLEATRGCEVSPEEIGAWVRGETPDATVLQLIRPLLALDWGDLARHGAEVPPACAQGGVADPLQMLIRLGHLPFEIPILGKGERIESAVPVRFDPEPLRLLAAGDLDRALRVVISRLGASGLRPVFRRAVATSTLARRLAASLAFPISRQDAGRAARLVCKPYDVKDAEALPFTV
jgi:CRISPR-associated protein Csx17